jgi:hypothetical protein
LFNFITNQQEEEIDENFVASRGCFEQFKNDLTSTACSQQVRQLVLTNEQEQDFLNN